METSKGNSLELVDPKGFRCALTVRQRQARVLTWIWRTVMLCLCIRLIWHEADLLRETTSGNTTSKLRTAAEDPHRGVCRPPLPSLLTDRPPHANDPQLAIASGIANLSLQELVSQLNIDSLVVGVVTSGGPIFEGSYGVLKANETNPAKRAIVNRDSIYRVASISKFFTTLETLILRDKGLINLDDPIDKYLPKFSHQPPDSGDEGPVTIRALLSHMAGIGGNLPPGDMPNWPHSLDGANPPPYNGLPFPSPEDILESQSQLHLANPPYTYPIYSNTAFAILGMVNLAAARRSPEYIGNVSTIEELIKRDVFDPLRMNSSGYLAASLGNDRVVVSSFASADADYDFKTSMNPSGGLFSTLADLTAPMRMLLNPSKNSDILSSSTIREWMKPTFAFYDDVTEVGMLWEINKYPNSFGDIQRLYQKSGQLMAYHAEFTVNPSSGYGVIVLMTGHYLNAQHITFQVLDIFQPAFDVLAEATARDLYTGTWVPRVNNLFSEIVITLRDGSLWVETMVLSGTDVLQLVLESEYPEPVALWPTGRPDQFRVAYGVAFGESWRNDERGYHCLAYAFGMELGYARGSAINEILFTGEGQDRALHVPSVGIEFRRITA